MLLGCGENVGNTHEAYFRSSFHFFFLFMFFCFQCSKTNGKECKKGEEISPIDTILELQQELLIVLFSDFYQPLH